MKRFIAFLSAIAMCLSVMCTEATDASAYDSAGRIVQMVDTDNKIICANNSVAVTGKIPGNNRTIATVAAGITSELIEELDAKSAYLYVDGELKRTYDINQIYGEMGSWVMPEKEGDILDAFFDRELVSLEQSRALTRLSAELAEEYKMTYEDGGFAVTPAEPDGAVATAGSFPGDQIAADEFPTYMYKQVGSTTEYSSVCGRNISIKVKDSLYSCVLISKTSKTSLELRFYALRQGYVYDYTTNMRDVSVISETGQGKVAMTWDFDSEKNCYVNPEWKIIAQADPFTISTSTIIANAKQIWETNISTYGYWKWGDV